MPKPKKDASEPKASNQKKSRIKLKLGLIMDQNFQNAFGKLLFVPFKNINDSWAVTKSLSDINGAIEEFTKLRNAKIRSYGEEKDGNISVTEANREIFVKEMNELAVKDIEIYLDHQLVISSDEVTVDLKQNRLTGGDLAMLDGFVTVQQPAEQA